MPFTPRPHFSWRLRTRTLPLGPRTLIMAILNVTPDSFSDGGQDRSPQAAIDRGLALLDAGADILDLGGESTRPGASPLPSEEELTRVLPVLTGILRARPEAILSIDTYHADTARQAVEAGAEIVNDVSGHLWDPAMSAICATLACGVILTHTRGRPTEWSTLPPLPPNDVLPLVLNDLTARIHQAKASAISPEFTVLDPGFGFGKLGPANLTLLAHLEALKPLDRPILAGLSRKGFLAPDRKPTQRLTRTIAANTSAILAGAHILRVHDVPEAIDAAHTADAILLSL